MFLFGAAKDYNNSNNIILYILLSKELFQYPLAKIKENDTSLMIHNSKFMYVSIQSSYLLTSN